MKRDYFTKADASKTYFLVLVVQIAVMILFALVPNGFVANLSENAYFCYLLLSSLLLEGAILTAVLIYNSKKKIDTFSAIEFKTKSDPINILICISISIIALFLTFHFFNYIDDAVAGLGLAKTSSSYNLNTWPKLIGSIFVLALVPAFVEEIVFRGSLLHGLKQYTMIGAVLLSSVCFAFFHLSVFQFFYQLYLAIFFALIVSFTQDIKLSMIMHFTNNFLVVLFEFLQKRYSFSWFFLQYIPFWATLLMFFVCSALIAGLIYIIKRRNENKIKKHITIRVEGKENLISYIMLYGTMFVQFVLALATALTPMMAA